MADDGELGFCLLPRCVVMLSFYALCFYTDLCSVCVLNMMDLIGQERHASTPIGERALGPKL